MEWSGEAGGVGVVEGVEFGKRGGGGNYVFRFRRDDGEFADWGGGFGEVEEVRQIGMRGTKVFRFKGTKMGRNFCSSRHQICGSP